MLRHGAVGSNASVHMYILTDYVTRSISYQRNSLLVLQLRSQEKTPRIESPPSVMLPCITPTPESSSFAVTGLPHVSLLYDLILFALVKRLL